MTVPFRAAVNGEVFGAGMSFKIFRIISCKPFTAATPKTEVK
jgi:putative component of membrane protein insertase Oxa1/YidC/SpoIIIJ protein YidD